MQQIKEKKNSERVKFYYFFLMFSNRKI